MTTLNHHTVSIEKHCRHPRTGLQKPPPFLHSMGGALCESQRELQHRRTAQEVISSQNIWHQRVFSCTYKRDNTKNSKVYFTKMGANKRSLLLSWVHTGWISSGNGRCGRNQPTFGLCVQLLIWQKPVSQPRKADHYVLAPGGGVQSSFRIQ